MTARLAGAVVPAYLLLCLFLGGSVQRPAFTLLLQLAGLLVIGAACLAAKPGMLNGPARRLLVIVVLLLLLFLLHLLPLPSSLWAALPGREHLIAGWALLGVSPPAARLSLAPHETLATISTLIPPSAVLLGLVLLPKQRPAWIA
jgi:hypothetical protein